MKFIKNKLSMLTLACSAILIIGCDKEEDTVVTPVVTPTAYTIPETYEFKDSQGRNTVDFNGQKERLDMLSEMVAYMKTSDVKGNSIDAAKLKAMYNNTFTGWKDDNKLGLTGSSKQLKNKTAFDDAGIQAKFESLMDEMAVASKSTVDGGPGTVGVWPKDGKGPYLQSGTGVEYLQLIEKGLMGAVFLNQMTANYLGNISKSDNTTAIDASNGKYYTAMEHHWDEAYGYLTSEINFPTNGTDRFWGKYVARRDGLLGSVNKIATAFRKGRAAITAGVYADRDAQATIIKNEMLKVCAGTAINYLNGGKSSTGVTRNHALSEAYVFIDILRFHSDVIDGKSPLTTSDIDAALGFLGTDYTAVTVENLNKAIDLIASKTGLDSVKANL